MISLPYMNVKKTGNESGQAIKNNDMMNPINLIEKYFGRA